MVTPWRVIALLRRLATLVESTLGTDLAPPRCQPPPAFEPGAAAWSWALLRHEATVFDAEALHRLRGRHALALPADRRRGDTRIGDEKLKELVSYAKRKGVGVHVLVQLLGRLERVPTNAQERPAHA